VPEGLLLAHPLVLHEAPLRALDHLAVLEGLLEPVYLVEAGDGEVQGGSKLPGTKWFEQERHDAGCASPRHERGRHLGPDQDDRADRDRCRLRGHHQRITLGELRGHDGHVGLGSLDELEGPDASAALGGRSAPGGDNGVAKRGAEAGIVVENRHAPARRCCPESGVVRFHVSSVEHEARCVKSQMCNGRGVATERA
jgi:hypothetical protein